MRATDTVTFDTLTDDDVALAYLPLAWVGDHYLNYAPGLVAGFCMACPENADTAMDDLREIGPTFYFAPPRMLEVAAHARHDPHGGRRRASSASCSTISSASRANVASASSTASRVPLGGRLLYAIGDVLVYGPLKNVLGFSRVRLAYTAGEAIGPELFAFYRSIGLNLKQLYGQTEAFLYVTAQPDGQVYSDTVGPRDTQRRYPHRRGRRGAIQVARHVLRIFQGCRQDRGGMTSDGYVKTGDAGYFDEKTGHLKIIDRAKDVGRLHDGTLFPPKYIENKLKFYPNIREVVAYRRQARLCCRDAQYRFDRGGKLGRAQQRRLRLLPGTGWPSAAFTT